MTPTGKRRMKCLVLSYEAKDKRTYNHHSSCSHSRVWRQRQPSGHCRLDIAAHLGLDLCHLQMKVGPEEQMEAAPSFLVHTPPCINTDFQFWGHFTRRTQHTESRVGCNVRVYGRYCVFSGARQHGSFGAGLCFHHKALRDTLTNPDLFGSLLTFILDLKIKRY